MNKIDFSNFILELTWRDYQKKLFIGKKRKSCVDLKLTPILEAWISALLTLYLHFIWSGPFSRLILFIYLLLHDFINLHCEEENLFWNKPRNNCIWIFFYYFDCILNLTNYVLPFWWWFKLGFQFVNTTLSH